MSTGVRVTWKAAPPHSLYDALPLGIYARVDCPSCGTGFCEAYIPVLLHAAIRDFLLRPRVLYEPATFMTYAGQDAISFRLVDLGSTETLTIMAHPQTLQLITAIRGERVITAGENRLWPAV